jgi:uncharacterized membrane protein YtjA (UPF0391 family)
MDLISRDLAGIDCRRRADCSITTGTVMFKWALIFALLLASAGILKYIGITGGADGIAQVLLSGFAELLVIFLLLSLFVIKSKY